MSNNLYFNPGHLAELKSRHELMNYNYPELEKEDFQNLLDLNSTPVIVHSDNNSMVEIIIDLSSKKTIWLPKKCFRSCKSISEYAEQSFKFYEGTLTLIKGVQCCEDCIFEEIGCSSPCSDYQFIYAPDDRSKDITEIISSYIDDPLDFY